MKFAVSFPNAAPPHLLVEMAVAADENGWDGVFLWDHIHLQRNLLLDVFDPWVILGAMAQATERVRLGAMVTPLPRRRPQKFAKEVVTLDHLSAGRVIVGVGLGFPADDEYEMFGESGDARIRAERLDEALALVEQLWSGEPVDHSGTHYRVSAQLLPRPVQRPRPPIWVAATGVRERPLARAARFEGVFPMSATGEPPTVDDIRAVAPRMPAGVDIVASWMPDASVDEYADAGVTWLVDSRWPDGDWIDELRDTVSRPPQ